VEAPLHRESDERILRAKSSITKFPMTSVPADTSCAWMGHLDPPHHPLMEQKLRWCVHLKQRANIMRVGRARRLERRCWPPTTADLRGVQKTIAVRTDIMRDGFAKEQKTEKEETRKKRVKKELAAASHRQGLAGAHRLRKHSAGLLRLDDGKSLE